MRPGSNADERQPMEVVRPAPVGHKSKFQQSDN